jgi:transient receptor potential cation channel subfamily C protein 4
MMQLFWAWFSFWLVAMSSHEKLERKFWPSLHPALVAEGLLAAATILAFGRLLFLCQLHYKLGPMQVFFTNKKNHWNVFSIF